MNLKLMTSILSVLLITSTFAQKRTQVASNFQLSKPTGEPMATLININNFSMWIRADGLSASNPFTGGDGAVFPRGTAPVVYTDGIVWAGFVKDEETPELRVGGHKFVAGTVPGRILDRGVPEDPNAPDVRIWRIRKDYQTADLTRDAAEINNVPVDEVTKAQIEAVRQQYEKDRNEWPWEKGAPFYDDNGNGALDPGEEPGLVNADQVVWFVANDLDSTAVESFAGSPPIGLEMQVTLWAYNQPSVLGNVIFKRYRLIYKGTAATPSNAHIENMYLGQYSEPDIGDYTDDFAGCDSLLSLAYAYNSSSMDSRFDEFQLIPPAVGYDIIQGPMVPGTANDVAIFDLKRRPGFKNLPMTSFINDAAGSAFDINPRPGSSAKFEWF
ncbi:hypothetical protein GWO43_08475, partial [candidate division KSB1 bacterium]|nr:hypothetical protein [candidate division KSB1 bacterium]NIS25710.1 hypothetical protein [candidate division KSB1 bacterium]NIT70915.1 hypothetical protein [candidate division KSB1 bacterium]NIU26393.1 hypothetical protein [candidate division KSB1 bacterium]NIU90210.1 hypothetical protein [candidate division KSB1 bacterium]